MTNNGFAPAAYINTSEALNHLAKQLAKADLLAVDTESNSLHAYQSRVCLIQLSTRSADYILDPLTITDMSPLGALLMNPKLEKVIHAAEYDLICLKREYHFEIANLFDTSLAARLCGEMNIGLADLLSLHFNVRLDKRHQLDNWLRRPLPADSLQYAQMDTHYLPALRDLLRKRMQEIGLLEEALEIFVDSSRVDARANDFDPEGFWKIGRPGALSRRQMALLRELYLLRDTLAREEDTPPFKILSNGTLIEIARGNPTSLRELSETFRLQEWQIRVYGEQILAALERGRTGRVPHPPASDHPDPVLTERYVTLHAWRKERGIQRGLDSNLIISRRTLWDIAAQMPTTMDALAKIPGMGKWRMQHYGTELLALIAKMKK